MEIFMYSYWETKIIKKYDLSFISLRLNNSKINLINEIDSEKLEFELDNMGIDFKITYVKNMGLLFVDCN